MKCAIRKINEADESFLHIYIRCIIKEKNNLFIIFFSRYKNYVEYYYIFFKEYINHLFISLYLFNR